MMDHYATLGLAPYAEHAVIRAAYLALMRRYHPDRNQSADAAERARKVTAAYEVLGNRERRMDYDLARAEARAPIAGRKSIGSGLRRAVVPLFALLGIAMLLMLFFFPIAPEVAEPTERELAVSSPQPAPQTQIDPAARCSSASNAELIKQELFARAADIRGSDRRVYRRLATYTLIRLQSANFVRTDDDSGTLYCNASIGVDLPPGVAFPGGRRSVNSDIGFSLKLSEGGGGRGGGFALHEGTIARELATLVSVRATVNPSTPTEQVDARATAEVARPPAPIIPAPSPPAYVEQPPRAVPAPRIAPAPRVAPPRAVSQQPQKASLRCGAARNGAVAACNSPAISSLDRDLGMLFRQSVQRADAAKQRTLYRDHDRFVARLNRCSSEACASAEYLGRMREVGKTMVARAQSR